jgi:predicted ATPase
VRDVVRRRLSGLGEPTTRLLALAAVLGREIDLAVLVAAEGGDADDCLDALEPALASRIVLAVPDAPARFRFATRWCGRWSSTG